MVNLAFNETMFFEIQRMSSETSLIWQGLASQNDNDLNSLQEPLQRRVEVPVDGKFQAFPEFIEFHGVSH